MDEWMAAQRQAIKIALRAMGPMPHGSHAPWVQSPDGHMPHHISSQHKATHGTHSKILLNAISLTMPFFSFWAFPNIDRKHYGICYFHIFNLIYFDSICLVQGTEIDYFKLENVKQTI